MPTTISKQQAIKTANMLTLENIRFYMSKPNAKYNQCDNWINSFILWLANSYNENTDKFADIVTEFNKQHHINQNTNYKK